MDFQREREQIETCKTPVERAACKAFPCPDVLIGGLMTYLKQKTSILLRKIYRACSKHKLKASILALLLLRNQDPKAQNHQGLVPKQQVLQQLSALKLREVQKIVPNQTQ